MMGLDQYQAVLAVAGEKNVPVIMDVDLGHLAPMMPVSYTHLDVYKRQVLAASLFHYKELEIRQVKEYLREKGISVRL